MKATSKYSGLRSQILASFPCAAAFFSTYDLTKHTLVEKVGLYETPSHMISAVCGEVSQTFLRNPFELIKQNMQLGRYNSISQAVTEIYKINGLSGFYRGYFVTVMREIPFGIIQYPLYEKLKKRQISKNKTSNINFCLCGAIAGGTAGFLTAPIDFLKTRVMTNRNSSQIHTNILSLIKNIYHTEGLLKFFSGVHIRVTYISIGGTMFFGANEYSKKLLNYNI